MLRGGGEGKMGREVTGTGILGCVYFILVSYIHAGSPGNIFHQKLREKDPTYNETTDVQTEGKGATAPSSPPPKKFLDNYIIWATNSLSQRISRILCTHALLLNEPLQMTWFK